MKASLCLIMLFISMQLAGQEDVKKIETLLSKSAQVLKNYYAGNSREVQRYQYKSILPSSGHVYDALLAPDQELVIKAQGSLEKDRQMYYVLTYGSADQLKLSATSSSDYYSGTSERFRELPAQQFDVAMYQKFIQESISDASIHFLGAEYMGSVRKVVIRNNGTSKKYIKVVYFERPCDQKYQCGTETQEYQHKKNALEKSTTQSPTYTKTSTSQTSTPSKAAPSNEVRQCSTCKGSGVVSTFCSINGCNKGIIRYESGTEKVQEGAYMRTITKKVPIACGKCNGTGKLLLECRSCGGRGYK